MSERWLPVVGYEGLYEVSDLGNVRAVARMAPTTWGLRWRNARPMSAYVDKTSHGYRCCGLYKDGRATKYGVHTLVLEAFVGPRPEGMQACHDDGDRAHSALANLRWDTIKANHADKLRHGTHQRGERSGKARLSAELVQWIRESPQSSLALAPALGVASSTIRAVRLGQNWSTP